MLIRGAGTLVCTMIAAVATAADGPTTIHLPDSDITIRLWEAVAADGRLARHYAISLDGRVWNRARQTSYEILLRYDRFEPLVRRPVVPELLAVPDVEVESRIEIVQFITQPLEEYRRAIRDLGGQVYHYLANHAHLVRMTPAVAEQVRALPFVRWVGPYQPAYRLEGFLLDNLDAADQVYPVQRYNIMVFEAGPAQKNAVADRIAAMGGEVHNRNAGKFLIEATLTPAQLFAVSGFNEVLFVDRWSPVETDMDLAREIGGANYVESLTGFSGEGVRGEVIDVGFNVEHVDFTSNPLILHTPVDTDSHGAATSGIVFGDGSGNPIARGMLPTGQGIVADAGLVFNGVGRYDHTGALLGSPYFAVFQSSSVGNEQVLDYTTISADTDAMLFDFDILHCQSQSNTGNQNSRPQAWAKNIVSVGGIRHLDTLTTGDDCWNCDSTKASIGPAADGRIKPDLAHFYDNIFTVTSGAPTNYTTSFGGTSGATPIVAGYFGIFFQMWSEGVFGYPVNPGASVFANRPHMATAKAMLINTAESYPFAGPLHDLTRVHQGWGLPSLRNLYDLRQKMFIVDETNLLTNLGSAAYSVTVDPGEPAARFTLVYADPPGVPASAQHRINDLSLRVTDPVGTVYWGNNGLLDGTWSTPGGVSNTVDTVENVFVENPASGTWTVEVLADEINQDGHVETPALDADFALVVTGVQQVLPALVINLPLGVPDLVEPETATPIVVEIIDGAEAVQAGSPALHYRFDPGDAFVETPMTFFGGVSYLATLPAAACEATPQLYFSARGDAGSDVFLPPTAPSASMEVTVGTNEVVVTDDFETDQGWTVVNDPSLTDGQWERGVPAGNGGFGDPLADFDGSGQCYLTDNAPGNSDVDDGITRLISPVFDLTGLDATVHYAVWYSNDGGPEPLSDLFSVYVSNDGGSNWVPTQTFGPASGGGWARQSFTVGDFVESTAQVRVRFEASDLEGPSLVEAGIDAFAITKFQCIDSLCPADLDADGVVAVTDLLTLLSAWGTDPGGPPDLDDDGDVGVADLLILLGAWGPC